MTSWLCARHSFQMLLRTVITLGVIASPSLARAQVSFEVLHAFAGGPDDGARPEAALVQASDGALYGTTFFGGLSACFGGPTCGTIFKITTDGDFTLMHRFNNADGRGPLAELVDDGAGRLWGTTSGNELGGEVFYMTADGSIHLVTVFPLGTNDVSLPAAAVVHAADGNWYGTALVGGGAGFVGGVFQVVGGSGHQVVHRFSGPDGARPVAALIQAADGNLYGTTSIGGDFDLGTIFQMTLSDDHTLTVLHSFSGADGSHPTSALIQASDGNFYGTTGGGGDSGVGTIFQLTPDGTFSVMYSFSGPDGANPGASLMQASDGNLYGTTANGGDFDQGSIFQMTLDGAFSVVYVFTGDSDGSQPLAGLIQADDGNLYGTTSSGGSSGMGTVFRLDTRFQ